MAEIDAIKTKIDILKSNKESSKLQALIDLWNLSVSEANQTYIGSQTNGYVPVLTSIISKDKGDLRYNALGCLNNLCISKDNKLYLATPELGFIQLLITVINSDNEKARIMSLKCAWNVSVPEKNQIYLGSLEGLVQALKNVIATQKGDLRYNALGCLANLCIAKENHVHFASTGLGLVKVLMDVLSTDHIPSLEKATACLNSLANSVTENQLYLGSADLGLVPKLLTVIKSDHTTARLNAIKCLWNSSVPEKNQISYGSFDGLVPLLLSVISSDKGDLRYNALGCLNNLCIAKENQQNFTSTKLGLLRTIKIVIESDQGTSRDKATACLYNISSNSLAGPGTTLLTSEELGFVPLLMSVISSNNGVAREKALGCFLNMATVDENRKILASAGVIPLLLTTLENSTGEAKLNSIWCLGTMMKLTANIPSLLECKGIEKALSALKASTDSTFSFRCLMFFMNACRYPPAAKKCRENNGVDIINPHVNDKSRDGLIAAIIIAFLTGEDESRAGQKSLLESQPNLADLLVSVVTNTVNGLDGKEYIFGLFHLTPLVRSILSLAISDSNKAILVVKPVLKPLVTILSVFAENGPPISYKGTHSLATNVGGGGNCVESAEAAIEALVQLAFYYESDVDLRLKYMVPELKIKEIFSSLSTNNKLSESSKRSVSSLLNRLQDKAIPVGSAATFAKTVSTPSSSVTTVAAAKESDRHIMVSYAWGCKKELVVGLCQSLRDLGLDIWRDEEGSKILAPMVGATDERMAEAIELSHTVVICVSSQYKSSANCRQEGKYANTMFKRGKVNIIYLMMDDAYTTVSQPNCVDGWLGIMIGDALWYPCWHTDHVSSAVSNIVKLAGKVTTTTTSSAPVQSNTTNTQSPNAKPAVIQSTPTTVTSTATNPSEDAWKYLTDSAKVTDLQKLTVYLEELGLTDSSLLCECDEEMIHNIAEHLKPIPKKGFVRLMSTIKTT